MYFSAYLDISYLAPERLLAPGLNVLMAVKGVYGSQRSRRYPLDVHETSETYLTISHVQPFSTASSIALTERPSPRVKGSETTP